MEVLIIANFGILLLGSQLGGRAGQICPVSDQIRLLAKVSTNHTFPAGSSCTSSSNHEANCSGSLDLKSAAPIVQHIHKILSTRRVQLPSWAAV